MASVRSGLKLVVGGAVSGSALRLGVAACAAVALSASVLSPARACVALQEPTVEEVLANVRKAVGIDALSAQPYGVVLVGDADFSGMPCTYLHVVGSEGRDFRRTVGPITIEGGFDGEREWMRDIGGEARVLGLGEEVDSRVSGLIVTGGWLREGSPFVFTGLTTEAGASVLAFTMEGAEGGGTVSIDNATWRPTRWTFSEGAESMVVELSGEVATGQIRVPARIEQIGRQGERAVVEIDEVRPAGADDALLLTPDLSAPRDTRFDAGVPARLEVKRAPTGHLLVHPLVNGRDVGWFIFDTGAGANVLSTSAQEALGLETFGDLPAVGVGGTTRTAFLRPETLTLGCATFERPLMIQLDLAFLTPHMGVEVGGIVGYSVLARTISEVDLARAEISIHDPTTYRRADEHWADLIVKDRVPCVKASFEGHEGWFRIDTGANSSVTIHEPAVRRLGLLEGRETSDTKLGGVGGFVPAKAGVLEWFELGGTRIDGVKADFATEAKGAFAEPRTIGNIGTKLLEPFVLVLDYPHGRMAFVPREAPAE